MNNQQNPYSDWGNVSIWGGFYYHQYGNGYDHLSLLDLPTRTGDRPLSTQILPYWYCQSELRQANQISLPNKKENKTDDYSKTEVQLSPNPFRNNIEVLFNKTVNGKIEISLIDIFGNKVNDRISFEGNVVNTKRIQLKCNDIPSGSFQLIIKSEDFFYTFKVVSIK